MRSVVILILMIVYSLQFYCCSSDIDEKHTNYPSQFQLLKKERTGVDFNNELKLSPEFSVFTYMNFFNGGGVSVGDFNKDGLEDLFFTSNQGANKLYLNQGDFKFRDVTEEANLVGQDGWTTGTSVVDINNDGLLDIYVGQLGNFPPMNGTNQLYVCQEIKDGIPIFADKAHEFGIAFSGLAQQASFFDYDLDGDLDMFQLNHSVHQEGISRGRDKVPNKDERSGDRLLRNDAENGVIKFTDVTMQSGIYSNALGFGLGVVMGDINLDGWPDIYICNDFHENDYLYLNQQDGTFKESVTDLMMHTSRFSMGVDMADINNDGWSEIFTLDMLPEDPYILKTSIGEDLYQAFQLKLSHGYNYQFARNNLQLNNGNGTFSEIGIFSGVHASDWSWASLFFDFDHDGYKDLFISNGIPRRMNDIDYVNFKLGGKQEDPRTSSIPVSKEEELLNIIEKMPQVKLFNKFFKNNGDLSFTDLENSIEGDSKSYSNGAAYADLDNDGDLDIVTNNIDEEAFIYKNLTIERADPTHNYLHFKFKGSPGNSNAIGAKVMVKKGEQQLVYEHYPVRGYMSSNALGLHIGVGDANGINEILVIWPDGSFQPLKDYQLNTTTTLQWEDDLPGFDFSSLQKQDDSAFKLEDVTGKSGLDFHHKENSFIEFNREALIPHMVSSEGPALAVGDVNGDGLEDVFLGSARGEQSTLYVQKQGGSFTEATPQAIAEDQIFEDVDAVFADIEPDGDLDLVIAAGGNEYFGNKEGRQQRAYINNGNGDFERRDIFPEAYLTASCILPSDFNGDGMVDFFIGGRAIPAAYGISPESYLYENKGSGTFELVTDASAPDLKEVGMVKDGAWFDIDNDGDEDLILAVEWQAIQIFINQGNHFEKKEINDLKGWWNFVLPYDFDSDGDVDLLAGNLGRNTRLQPTKEEPLRNYVYDYDRNGQLDQVLTYYLDGREYLFHTHDELLKQLVPLKKKYLYASDLAKATVPEIFGRQNLKNATLLEANFMQSAYFENMGNLEFETHVLPDELQFSTMEAAQLADLNNDGKMEVLIGGNFYDCNIEMGRYDADYGNVLSIGAGGKMELFPFRSTPIKGQVRKIKSVKTGKGNYYVFARNNDSIKVLK